MNKLRANASSITAQSIQQRKALENIHDIGKTKKMHLSAFKKTLFLAIIASAPVFMQSAFAQSGDHSSVGQSGKLLLASNNSLIPWHKEFQKTLDAAQKERKWVLVDVYTDWCGWCIRLDKDVYENSEAAAFINKNFVAMKANAEQGDGISVAKKFSVNSYPCTLVLDPKGREKGRISGYLDAKKFPKRLAEIINK